MKTTTITITAKFPTVRQALEASGMDISYNPSLARQAASDLERSNHHFKAVDEAFLCDDGKIRFLIKCNDGLTILNEFSPFCACLSDSPFRLVTRLVDAFVIHEESTVPKSSRKRLAKIGNVLVA